MNHTHGKITVVITDLGFPRRGHQPTILSKYSNKLHEMKEIGRDWPRLTHNPLESANAAKGLIIWNQPVNCCVMFCRVCSFCWTDILERLEYENVNEKNAQLPGNAYQQNVNCLANQVHGQRPTSLSTLQIVQTIPTNTTISKDSDMIYYDLL